MLPSELLLGFGLGLAFVPCISTATQNADPEDVGVTSAMTNTSQQIGASIGTALLNTIAASATVTYLASHHVQTSTLVADATVHGYAVASGWAAGIMVLAAVLAGLLINVNPGKRVEPAAVAVEDRTDVRRRRRRREAGRVARVRAGQPRERNAGNSASVITAARRGKILSSRKVCTSRSVSAHPSASTRIR